MKIRDNTCVEQNLYERHSITGRYHKHYHYYFSSILSLALITCPLSFPFFLFFLLSHSPVLYSLLPVPQLSESCSKALLSPNSNTRRQICHRSLFSMTSQTRNSQRNCHHGNIVLCRKMSSVVKVTLLFKNAVSFLQVISSPRNVPFLHSFAKRIKDV